MTAPIDIRLDFRRRNALVLQSLAQVGDYAAQGQVRAINRSASRLRTQGAKRIGKRVYLKAAYLRENIELRRLATAGDPAAVIVARARETRMDRFPNKQISVRAKNGSQKRAGIRVSIKRGHQAKVIKSAFYVPLRRGKSDAGNGMGIAVRVDVLKKLGYRVDTSSIGGKGSRKYEVLHTSSVRDLLKDEVEREGLGDEIVAYLESQIEAEMKHAIARARR